MINAAVIQNDTVTNIIYINESNMALFQAQGFELLDTGPLGLALGDRREEGVWYRETDGIQTALPILKA